MLWMRRSPCVLLLTGLSLLVSACITVGPDYVAPKRPVPAQLPSPLESCTAADAELAA
jgi:hypothetical protein